MVRDKPNLCSTQYPIHDVSDIQFKHIDNYICHIKHYVYLYLLSNTFIKILKIDK